MDQITIPTLTSYNLTPIQTLTARRGATTILAKDTQNHQYILKLSTPEDATDQTAQQTISREGEILRQLQNTFPNHYIDHGIHENTAWLFTHYAGDQHSANYAEIYRSTTDWPERFTKDAIAIIEKLSKTHNVGWLHRDIQPAHFILNEDKEITIIDWALAQNEVSIDNFPYKGALVHFAAPEVAAGMLGKDENIHYTRQSEIYALGATLYFLFTGQTPIDYGNADIKSVPFEKKLEAIINGNLRGDLSIAVLDKIFRKCLSKNQETRFQNLEELSHALSLTPQASP